MQDLVQTVLGADGPVARVLGGGYEPRAEQLRMAVEVARAMEERRTLLAEAGTGVGKSFAYLVPAIVRALCFGEKVVVATNTIALQEQLCRKDIPLLMSTLGERAETDAGLAWAGELRPVLVKGRNNYLSVRRLELASARQDVLFADPAARRSLHVIEDWAYQTTDGTLSTLPPLERSEVWDHAQSETDNCMGRKCPRYERCYYQQARKEREGANLLICNHAVFFSDLALRSRGVGMLPAYDHVVLDEAHNVEDVASEHLGMSLTRGRVEFLLRTLYDQRRHKGYLAQLSLHADAQLVERAIRRAHEAGLAGADFFDAWLHLIESRRLRNGRIREPMDVDNALSPTLRELSLALKSLRDTVDSEPDQFELLAYSRRAAELAALAEAFCDQSVGQSVYWVDVAPGRGRRPRVTLASAPVDVSAILREHLFERDSSVTLTSATLSTRTIAEDEPLERAETAFALVSSRLGCDGAPTLQLGSPFDYENQAELIIDPSIPEPALGGGRTDGGPAYIRALASRIAEHAAETRGGAFVLFTSFATLTSVANECRERLGEHGLTLLIHDAGVSRTALLDQFVGDDRAVLFGAASFWQGVDVRGDGLRNVIITRLPFEPPDRPLTEARHELIETRGGNPFMEDTLPRAVIRFKQGFGRLVRSHTDRGRVVVLDRRIVTKPYGRSFLKALPEGVTVTRRTEHVDDTRDDAWPPAPAGF